MSRGLWEQVKFEKSLNRVSLWEAGGRGAEAEDNHSRGSHGRISDECLMNAGRCHCGPILQVRRQDTASDCEAAFLSHLLSPMSVF